MPDRENMIRKFEQFAAITEPGMPQCVTISAETVRDVLALLKEQEPRVMTLEEAREALHNADFIVIEDQNDIKPVLGIRTFTGFDLSTGAYLDFDDLDDHAKSGDYYVNHYNKDFRFWTAKPTPEQMRDTKWEGEKE